MPGKTIEGEKDFFGGETSRIGELFIDVSPPFLRVEIEWGVL